jgi:outer membrane protein TolC
MARALMLLPLAAAACFHATPWSPTAAQDQWRAMRDEETARTEAMASAKDGGGPSLTADETYALALAHSPDVSTLSALTDTKAAEIQAARQLENPQLRLTSFNIDDVLANQPALNIGLRWPIPRPGTVRARVAGASHAAESQRGLTDDAKRLLRGQIDLLFAQLAVLSSDLEQATRAAELRAERRDQLALRAGSAVATRVDVALAEVEQAQAGEDVTALRVAIADIEEQLARLAGVRGAVRFQVEPEQLDVVEATLDRDALIERALESRPDLRTTHALVVEAEAEAHVARAEAWPWFDWVQLQYRAGPGSPPTAFGFGVSITLPVLSWNRGAIKASKALVRQRRVEHDARIIAIADEVELAAARVERTGQRVLAIEQQLLPAVELATREARDAVATGALDPMEANDVELQAVDARRAHLSALLEHREAVVMLESVVGGSLDHAAKETDP